MAKLTYTTDPDTGCWLADNRAINSNGYVQLNRDGSVTRAHRWLYEHTVGPVPAGLQLDHLCRNRACINPTHLEAVTLRENVLRGIGPTAVNAAKTHCIHGHEFTAENTYLRPDDPRQRNCKECKRIRDRAWYWKKKRSSNV